MSLRVWAAFMFAALFVYGPTGQVSPCAADVGVPATADLRPEGVSASDWSGIRAA